MTKVVKTQPFENETPSEFANRLGILYTEKVTGQYKKDRGQFFTPHEIALFMAELSKTTQEQIAILDPGCGTAILSCALTEKLVNRNTKLKSIFLTVYETDQDILPYTNAALDFLKNWLAKNDINFQSIIINKDFVLENSDCFQHSSNLFSRQENRIFDVVISNPPYFKIAKEDKRAIVAKTIVWGQPNIYAIFLMVAAKLLRANGELIFITPRSFASGNYFRAFREAFFKEIELEQIHLFGSRTDTFNKDSVLQETLILKGKKQNTNVLTHPILVTHSNGIKDIQNFKEKLYSTEELIDLNSKEKILHLPANEVEEKVIKMFKTWVGSLNKYNIQISTGPVVSFRAKEYLYEQYQNGTVFLNPLYQLINTGKMFFQWPVIKKNKPQYIRLCKETKTLLLPNKNYIFLRRFSTKDDKSRLIAAPYYTENTEAKYIGVENHLNYIYRPNGELLRTEVLGLSALLNSKLFDTYFRTFNGNINVSATELRAMPLPTLEDIKQIGDQILLYQNFDQDLIDEIVNNHFDLEHIFAYD